MIKIKQKLIQLLESICGMEDVDFPEPEMITIPGGAFVMGSPEGGYEPQQQVTVQPFFMGKYPVTQAEYQAVMGKNPSHFSGNPRNPVERVSWFDAQAFCDKLSQLTGKNYRLPTEAEWEYACRAGTQTRFCFGDDKSQLGDYAWFDANSGSRSHPVGQKKPNAFGLYDMHGNVLEWCEHEDTEHEDIEHEDTEHEDTEHEDTEHEDYQLLRQLLRGGSWYLSPDYCRSAFRYWKYPEGSNYAFGLRVVASSRT